MTSNLPPGCSINDIPGNRPEDQEEEALYDAIYQIFEECGVILSKTLPEAKEDALAKAVASLVGRTAREAYLMGQQDEAFAAHQEEREDELIYVVEAWVKDSPNTVPVARCRTRSSELALKLAKLFHLDGFRVSREEIE